MSHSLLITAFGHSESSVGIITIRHSESTRAIITSGKSESLPWITAREESESIPVCVSMKQKRVMCNHNNKGGLQQARFCDKNTCTK